MTIRNTLFPPNSNHPRYYRIIEILAVAVFCVYVILSSVTLLRGLILFLSPTTIILLLTLFLFGYLAADFVSGFVHFLGDNYGDPQTPVVGPNLIAAFREHHVDEQAITRHDFFDVNGSNCIGSILILIPAYHLLDPDMTRTDLFILSTIYSFLILLFFTNQIHKWAHQSSRPAIVTWLQQKKLILSPEHHQVHHTAPHDRYYCITTGWLNPLLERIRFFEWILKITKKPPSSTTLD